MRSILIERESPKNLSDRCHILASALQQQRHAKDKLFSDLPKSSLSTSRQETIRPFFQSLIFFFSPGKDSWNGKWITKSALLIECESIVISKSGYRTSLSETPNWQCQALNVAVTYSLDSLNCYDQYQVKFFSFFVGSGEIRRSFSRHCNL